MGSAATLWWWVRNQSGQTSPYGELIEAAAWRHNIDQALVKAVVHQESSFDADARGAAGETGLMQLMPGAAQDWQTHHHRHLSAGALFDPALNIEIGTWYLARGLRQWAAHPDQEVLALLQYNAGRSHALEVARKHEKNVLPHIPITSTRHYIRKVLDYRAGYLPQSTTPANE